jgi:hypothetical protein
VNLAVRDVFGATGLADAADQRLDLLYPITRDNKDGVLRFDDHVALETHRGDETAFGDHKAFGRVLRQHVAPQGVAVRIGRQSGVQ